jgi:gamma-glutamyltranspeptidase/glutathione hydrolase
MHGIIAAGDPTTAEAAREVLAFGGDAVDAAIGAAFTAFVAEPLLASPGGGGMMTVRRHGKSPLVVDFFPAAPWAPGAPRDLDFEAIEVNFGSARQLFHTGRGAAAVPLALPGLVLAAERFATLPLSALVEPAVRRARDGVPMTTETAHVFRLLEPILERHPDTHGTLSPDRHPAAGSTLKNPDLAHLLDELGRTGCVPDVLWGGLLDHFGPAHGGCLTRLDLERNAPAIVTPRSHPIGAFEAFTSPRAGGQLVLTIANALSRQLPASTEAQEIVRLAHASLQGHQARRTAMARGSTTHLSVLDEAGHAASVTLTNGEGSGYVIPGTGVQVNNFLGEEDLHPEGFHRHPPGAPLPTMVAPTIAIRDGAVLCLGSGGSNRIRSSVGQVLYRTGVLDNGLVEAVRAPRVHAEDAEVWLELEGVADPDAAVAALEREFESVIAFPRRDFFFGGVQAVLRTPEGTLRGAADGRRGGAVSRA